MHNLIHRVFAGCSTRGEAETANPLEAKVRAFTLDIGSQLVNNCSSDARQIKRIYTNFHEIQGNKLEITMYVEWNGGTTGCHYRADGVLTINQDGSDPYFRRTDTEASPELCTLLFTRGCVRNFRPEPCRQ